MINHPWATLGEMGIDHREAWLMMRHTRDADRTAYQQELMNHIITLLDKYVEGHERPVNRVIQVTMFENGKKNISMYSGV